MKRQRSWRIILLVLALVLTLGLTVSLQASEDVSEDTTGKEVEFIDEDTDGADVVPGTYAGPAAEDPEPADEPAEDEVTVDSIMQVPPEEAGADAESGPDESGEDQTGAEKRVTFYLDWNGIDGLFGKCLTCTRKVVEGTPTMFTAEDAAVYNLNYIPEKDDELEEMSSEQKWAFLQAKWAKQEVNGYKFLGWSTQPKGGTLITRDTEVADGMSFYAYWTKGKESNETFDRVDPEAAPLEHIRIEAGAGTSFLSGTLHASKHAAAGNSLALNLFCTPVRAKAENVTWSVAVSNSVTPKVLFGSDDAAETVPVKAGETKDIGEVRVSAVGCSLTVTSNDSKEHVVTVSATAESTEGEKIASPTSATLSFAHSWDAGNVTKPATCETPGEIEYKCTVDGCTVDGCNVAKKNQKIPALEHVYNKSKASNKGDGKDYTVNVVKEPTCTEEGVNRYTYYCLRCGSSQSEEGPVPALGHDWSEAVRTPAACNKDTETISCTRCGMKKVSLVPAYNPQLHVWKETYRYNETCMSDIVYEQCEVCRETRMRKEAADNPDRHSYAFESRVSNSCSLVTYTFKCVHGCGSTQVMLKKEENHSWSSWTTSTSWDRTTGTMKRIRTRKCSRCGEEETEDLDNTAEKAETPVGAQTQADPAAASENSAPTGQAVNYTAGNAVAVAAAAQADPSTATASEGKAGWKKSGKKKYYLNENGKKKTGWQKIGGKKYYFGKDGVMRTGWQTIKGKKYYFGKDGAMRTGKQKIGKKTYNFGKNGVLK